MKKYIQLIVCSILIISLTLSQSYIHVEANDQSFNESLSKELEQYIKKSGATVSIEYRELGTGDTYQWNPKQTYMAASTIKFPLAMYIMELADQKKIDLSEKLTYKKHHYIGGSGVIQKQKVGTKYTIQDLLAKSMKYSDNIAFAMLKEKVGEKNFVNYMKQIGASYSSPNALSNTTVQDLIKYTQYLYDYSQKSSNGKELIGYLQNTIYNETIPTGVKDIKVAHKVGMIPMYQLSHDVGIIYDQIPFALAIMTKGVSYEKSKKIISDIASIVYKHHKQKIIYITTNTDILVYAEKNQTSKIATLNKYRAFKLLASNGEWLEIQFGNTKAFIKNSNVVKSTKAPFVSPELTINRNVFTYIATEVFVEPSTEATSFATIEEGVKIAVSEINNNFYTVKIGDRVGYINADDVFDE